MRRAHHVLGCLFGVARQTCSGHTLTELPVHALQVVVCVLWSVGGCPAAGLSKFLMFVLAVVQGCQWSSCLAGSGSVYWRRER